MDKKLIAFYTDSGNANSEEAYIWENTIKQVSANPDCSNTCVIVTEEKDADSKELIEKTEKTEKTESTKKKKLFGR
jgi:2-C-methyl-D-erythritol 4-phosphate cytidylyltransferase